MSPCELRDPYNGHYWAAESGTNGRNPRWRRRWVLLMASVAAWLVASAAGSAAARGLFELGTAPYWGVLLAAAQGLFLRRLGVPYLQWLVWSTGGWAVGALIGARLVPAGVHLGATPPGLLQTLAVFSILGAAELGALRTRMPVPFTWVALNAMAGVVITYIESPVRVLLFAPVEAAAGMAGAEAAVGAALGAAYGAITAPQMVRIRPPTKRPVRNQ